MSEAVRTIRWGLLGTGGVAASFARDLRIVPGAELVAVASRNAERAAAFAREVGAARAYGSYEALVEDPEIEVVYVSTANSAHRDHCLLCLEHGKAVLCEKPFAVSADDARSVIAKAREQRLFCMEAMWMRFTPLVRELPTLIESGVIGELRMATIQLGFSNAPNPARDVFNPVAGGGSLLDLGVYPLALASLVFGTPTEIASQAVIGATGVDEQVGVLLRYSGDRQAVVTASIRSTTSNDATIMGTHGYLHVHGPLYSPTTLTHVRTTPNSGGGGGAPDHPRLRQVYAHVKRYVPLRRPGQRKTIYRPLQGIGYSYEAAEVMRCLRAGELESPLLPLDETVRLLEGVERIREQWAISAVPQQIH